MERIPVKHRIATKIFAALVIVATLAVTVTGTVLVSLAGKTLRSNISQRNLQIARRASNEISLYIENSLNELRAAADVISALPDPWLQDALLENLAVTFKRFQSIHLIAESGQLLASTLLDRRDLPAYDTRALARAREGELYLSAVSLSAEGLPYLSIALPAGGPGAGRQVLAAELALRDIWNLVDDISFGDQGQALLVSADGILIAHPDKTRVIGESEETSLLCAPAGSSAEGEISVARLSGQAAMLMACAPVKTTNWRVVIQQPLAEAYLPIRLVLLQSLVLLAAMLGVALAAALFLTRLYSAPLNLLLAGTARIGRGDLDHRIDLARKDEIGRLSASFDRMVGDLKEWSLKLRESEERYRLMAESVEDIIFSLDRQARLLLVNRRAEAVSGYPLPQLLGRRCLDFLSPASRRKVAGLSRQGRFWEAEGGRELEVELETRAGAIRVLEVKLVEVFDSAGRFQFYGVARDITERKEAEGRLLAYQQQLRSLASQLSLAEARERKRIAADLHDRIGQALALTQIRLGSLKARALSAGQARSIKETMSLIEQTIREVRTLIFSLSSPLLYEVGLKAALEQLAEQFQDEHGIKIVFTDDQQPKPLGIDGSVLLFQAAKELMLNVVKHAGARRIHLGLLRSNDTVHITVEDDGAGFDVSQNAFRPGRQGGYGLFSIRERLEYLGGGLEIRSQPGQGTRATLAFRLKQDTIEAGTEAT